MDYRCPWKQHTPDSTTLSLARCSSLGDLLAETMTAYWVLKITNVLRSSTILSSWLTTCTANFDLHVPDKWRVVYGSDGSEHAYFRQRQFNKLFVRTRDAYHKDNRRRSIAYTSLLLLCFYRCKRWHILLSRHAEETESV